MKTSSLRVNIFTFSILTGTVPSSLGLLTNLRTNKDKLSMDTVTFGIVVKVQHGKSASHSGQLEVKC